MLIQIRVLKASLSCDGTSVMTHQVLRDAIEPAAHLPVSLDFMSTSMGNEKHLLHDVIDVRASPREALNGARQKRRMRIKQRRDIE